MTLPNDAKLREQYPIYDYMYGYFPDAFLEEVRVSWVGNQQHNPGEKMHWARDKSTDHMNKALRHIDNYARGELKDVDGTYHLAKAIWRLKARLQLDIEAERKAGGYPPLPWGNGPYVAPPIILPKNSLDPEAGSSDADTVGR